MCLLITRARASLRYALGYPIPSRWGCVGDFVADEACSFRGTIPAAVKTRTASFTQRAGHLGQGSRFQRQRADSVAKQCTRLSRFGFSFPDSGAPGLFLKRDGDEVERDA